MIPLRITATLAEPVASYLGQRIHLDALLEWCAFRAWVEAGGDPLTLPPLDGPDPITFDLPLLRWAVAPPPNCPPQLLEENGLVWGWCASAETWSDDRVLDTTHARRRPPLDAMIGWSDAKRADIGLGPTKAMNKPVPTEFASAVQWWACGDEGAVRELLTRYEPSLGRLRGHGHGRVLRWDVEPCTEEWWCVRDGRVTRNLPATWPGVSGRPRVAAVRAPYYHRSRQVACLCP